MKILLTGTHIDLTNSIREYVDEKVGSISKLLVSSQDQSAEARVQIGRPSSHHRKGDVHYAEINVHVGRVLFRATENHADIRTAIDLARDEIKRQIRKKKTKEQSKRRKK